jgi:hypothetical protein
MDCPVWTKVLVPIEDDRLYRRRYTHGRVHGFMGAKIDSSISWQFPKSHLQYTRVPVVMGAKRDGAQLTILFHRPHPHHPHPHRPPPMFVLSSISMRGLKFPISIRIPVQHNTWCEIRHHRSHPF